MTVELLSPRTRVHERLRGYALLLAAIAAGLLTALALSLDLLWAREQQARAEFSRGIAATAIGLLDRGNDRIDRSLQVLAGALAPGDPTRLAHGGPVRDGLDQIRHIGPLLVSTGLADATGGLVAVSTAADRRPETSLPDPDMMRAHQDPASDAFRIGGPVDHDGVAIFTLSRGLRDADGRLAGILYATVDATAMIDTLRPAFLKDRGRLVVLSDRFIVLAHDEPSRIGSDLSADPVAERIRAGEDAGAVRTTLPDGGTLVTGFAVSRRPGLVVLFQTAAPSFAAAWLRVGGPVPAIIAALIVCGIVLMVILVVRLRRDAEEAERLRESSEVALRDSIESMGEGFVLWDRDERLVLWNRRYPELLPHVRGLLRKGVHLEEIRAESARRAFPNLDEAGIQAWLAERHRHRQRRRDAPFEFVLADDRVIEVVEHTTSHDGRVAIYRDVTVERRATRELSASEARFRDGIESIDDGFVLWDPDDRVTMWNRRYEELLPYARAVLHFGMRFDDYIRHVVGINHASWTEAERQQRIAERIAQHRDRNRASEFTTGDGRTIEVRETATSNGGCVSLFRDVTETRRLLARLTTSEAELQRALDAERELNAQQRRFVSMASHEFRTPLAIIDSSAQRLAALLAAADGDILRRLTKIRSAVSRMTEIIDRTLSTARLDDGQLEFAPAACDLARILREVCERQRSISPRHEIVLDTGGSPLEIHADVRMLDQVFTNLLSNAVKYSGTSTRIEIAAEETPDHVAVSVTDHGIGIPPEDLDRLFTRYFRASSGLSIPGTGIGLHLVKELVTIHGGTVGVRSELRRGSTFLVRLPRRPASREPRAAA